MSDNLFKINIDGVKTTLMLDIQTVDISKKTVVIVLIGGKRNGGASSMKYCLNSMPNLTTLQDDFKITEKESIEITSAINNFIADNVK